MSNTTDKSLEAIDAALVALTAINKSSEISELYVDPEGNPVSREAEIEIIHSIANEAVELLHDYLDGI